MSFLLENYSLVESAYLFIRCNKTKFFLRNTYNTDRNGVNKQSTHTKHLEKDNTGKGWLWWWRGGVGWGTCLTMSLDISEFLFFGSSKEASNDVTTFLNLRFITKQKPALFWENIAC